MEYVHMQRKQTQPPKMIRNSPQKKKKKKDFMCFKGFIANRVELVYYHEVGMPYTINTLICTISYFP